MLTKSIECHGQTQHNYLKVKKIVSHIRTVTYCVLIIPTTYFTCMWFNLRWSQNRNTCHKCWVCFKFKYLLPRYRGCATRMFQYIVHDFLRLFQLSPSISFEGFRIRCKCIGTVFFKITQENHVRRVLKQSSLDTVYINTYLYTN